MRSGFTLIELVIGLFISSIILLALYSSFYVTGKVIKASDDIINTDFQLAILANQFENDLSGIFVPIQLSSTTTTTFGTSTNTSPQKQGAQEEKETAQKEIKDIFVSSNKDSSLQLLSCITNNPLQTYRKEGPAVRMVRVVYKLIPNEDKTAFILTRQESPNLDLKAFEIKGQQGIRAYEVAQNIKSLQVEYRYPESTHHDEAMDTKGTSAKDAKAEEQKPIVFKTVKEWGKENSSPKEKESTPPIPQFIIVTLELWDLPHRQSQTFILNYTIASFNAAQQDKKTGKKKPQKKLNEQKIGNITTTANTPAKP